MNPFSITNQDYDHTVTIVTRPEINFVLYSINGPILCNPTIIKTDTATKKTYYLLKRYRQIDKHGKILGIDYDNVLVIYYSDNVNKLSKDTANYNIIKDNLSIDYLGIYKWNDTIILNSKQEIIDYFKNWYTANGNTVVKI
jgi:hypothetical protein